MVSFRIFVVLLNLILLFFLFGTAKAEQDPLSGNANYKGCEAAAINNITNEEYVAGYCTGVVTSASYVMIYFKLACLPTGVTIGQELKVVYKYMQNHPEQLNVPLIVIANAALTDAFPCQKK